MDDNLDYFGHSVALGKNVGDDFAEGKVTLPIIAAIRNGNSEQASFLKDAVLKGRVEDLDIVLELIKKTEGLDYTQKIATNEKCKAVSCLGEMPQSAYRTALKDLAEFSITRQT